MQTSPGPGPTINLLSNTCIQYQAQAPQSTSCLLTRLRINPGKSITKDEFVRYSCTTRKVRCMIATQDLLLHLHGSSSPTHNAHAKTHSHMHACTNTHVIVCLRSPPLQVYTTTFNILQKSLELSCRLDLEKLVLQYGCSKMQASIQRLLLQYKARFLDTLPREQQLAADFSRPAFLAAAFYLTARKNKVRLPACLPACLPCVPACLPSCPASGWLAYMDAALGYLTHLRHSAIPRASLCRPSLSHLNECLGHILI